MRLTNPSDLQILLGRHGWRPQKRFGQHFLVSDRVVDAIIRATDGLAGILEVGPGPGVLTSRLAERAAVTAVEIDPVAVSALTETAPDARVVAGDALDTDLAALTVDLPEPRGIVSNMPYNITGPLLGRFQDLATMVDRLVLMMQKEVGERILAQAGTSSRGSLSVVMQREFTIDRVCLATSGAFYPPPKVDSVVLRFVPRSGAIHPAFRAWVSRAFRQPRKTLTNNLASHATVVAEWLSREGLSPSARPHQLTNDQWSSLVSQLEHADG